jgi:hypothetical protein
MSNITRKSNIVSDIIRKTETATTDSLFRQGGEIILADDSSSMSEMIVGPDGRISKTRRIDAVNQAISSYGPSVQTIAFSSRARHVGPVTLMPYGSTPMAAGLAMARESEPNYILVLSDGEVDSPPAALDEARRMSEYCIIDTLYIGEDNPSAEQFMRELAQIGHGKYKRYDMTKPQQLALETVIKGLLPAPGDGAIKL